MRTCGHINALMQYYTFVISYKYIRAHFYIQPYIDAPNIDAPYIDAPYIDAPN